MLRLAPISRLAAAGAAIAVAVGCGGRQRPAVPEDETPIAQVRLVGVDSVDEDELLGGLGLAQARATGIGFDPYLVRVDVERIRGFYLRRGFFGVDVDADVDEQEGGAVVTFEVDEGPRAPLARIEIAGLPPDSGLDEADLRALVALEPGDPFRYEAYEDARPLVLAALERAGYCHVRVDGTVAADTVRHEAVIRYELAPGPRCRYGDVAITGIEGPLADAARARVALHVRPGERYSSADLAAAKADLYAMGRFSVIRVEAEREGGDEVVPIEISVVDGTRHELRLGAGVGLDPATYELRTRAAYKIAGWPRPLMTTRVEVRPAYVIFRDLEEADPRVEAIAALERLDLFRPHLIGEAEASLAYLTVEAYTSVGPRVRLGIRTPILRPEPQVALGWQLQLLQFTEVDEAITAPVRDELGLDDAYRLGFFEQTAVLDLRDDPLTPRLGTYAEIRVEEGTVAAGGAFTYLRVTPELRGYVPVPLGGSVLAARARVGGVFGDLPVTQRYLSGGATGHRGFPERRLSPTATAIVEGEERSVVIGGGGMIETGVELRTPLGEIRDVEIGSALFLDGGDVTPRFEDLDLGNLYWAAGLGLRVGTLVGPVRLDVAYQLNRTDLVWASFDRVTYHIGIGEAF